MEPETAISLEINNPIFSEDIFPGNFSMPFTLPASPENSILTGFPEIIELKEKPKLKHAASLEVEGLPFQEGELILRGVSNDKYKVNFQSGESLLNTVFADKTLHDLPHEIIKIVDWNQATSSKLWDLYQGKKWVWYNAEQDHLIPETIKVTINGQTFESTSPTLGTRLQQLADQINGADIGVSFYYEPVNAMPNQGVRFTTTRLGLTEPLVVDMHDPSIWNLNASDSWIHKYNQAIKPAFNRFYENEPQTADFVFPHIYNPKFFEGQEGRYFPDLNRLSWSAQGFDIREQSGFIPCFTFMYIIQKIEQMAGIKIKGDFLEDPDVQKLIFFNSHALSFFEKPEPRFLYHVVFDKINPVDHIPAMGLTQMFIELGLMFCLGFQYSEENKTLEVFKKKNLVQSKNFTAWDKVSPAYGIDYQTFEGVSLGYKWNDKDEMYKNEGGGEMIPAPDNDGKKIEPKFYTTFTRPQYIGYPTKISVPTLIEKGSFYPQTSETQPRLLFFRKVVKIPEFNFMYSLASSTSSQIENYSLAWQGANGIYSRFWREWAQILENTTVRRKAYLDIVDVLNFNPKRKYKIDGNLFFIKKMSFSVSSRTGLGPVDLELLKCD